MKAKSADFEFIAEILRSALSPDANATIQTALTRYQKRPSTRTKRKLVALMEREIRYAGSSDLAYFFRSVWKGDGGIPADKLILDVGKKLGVKLRPLGPPEAKLERLVKAVAEKELLKMEPEAQRQLFEEQRLGADRTRQVLAHLKRTAPVVSLPLLMRLIGQESVEKIVTAMVIRVIGAFVGRQGAQHLFQALATRFPWWADWIGPVAWGLSGIWLVYDIQGPAYRKTIPVLLYLGLIQMRETANDSEFEDEFDLDVSANDPEE